MLAFFKTWQGQCIIAVFAILFGLFMPEDQE